MALITKEKIDKLAEILSKEIAERKTAIDDITEKQEEQRVYVTSLIPELKEQQSTIGIELDNLQKIKQEILGYTIQCVTIIVGLFAIIMTIMVIFLNPSLINEHPWFYITIMIIFIVVYISWFVLWIIRE